MVVTDVSAFNDERGRPVATGATHSSGTTIYSVAERAGVSIASVSRVLQGSTAVSAKTRQRVLDAAEELKYVPLAAARSLAVRHHEAHGLVLPELSGPYYSELLMGFESRAADLGQSVVLMLAEGKDDLPAAVRKLATRVDGLAMLGSSAIPESTVTALHGSKPVVLIAGDPRVGRRHRHLGEHPQRRGDHQPRAGPRPHRAPSSSVTPTPVPTCATGMPASSPPTRRPAVAAPEPVRIALREVDGTALADRILSRRPRDRRPRLRERRARARRDEAAARGRQERARRRRRRRLGRRDDRPLRRAGADHGPPARARARRPGRRATAPTASPASPSRTARR